MYRILLSLVLIFPLLATQVSAAEELDKTLVAPQEGDIVLGQADAPVFIVEYASLSCPHCAHFHNKVLPTLKKNYIETGKVKLVFRPFPLNLPAMQGSILTYCAGDDHFYNFLKVLFDTQDSWAFNKNYLEMLTNIGKLGGVKGDQFDKCLADKELEGKILSSKQYAVNALKVRATPTFFINGKLYEGEPDVGPLSSYIDELLAGQETAPAEAEKKAEKPEENAVDAMENAKGVEK